MSALDQIATARDDTFSARVSMITFKVAQAVATEDVATPDHAVRLDYALRNIRGGENPKLVAAHLISSNPTIGAAIDANPELKGSNIPDGDIEFALSSIWTARSLAFAAVDAPQ
jgi:hypothetical protein